MSTTSTLRTAIPTWSSDAPAAISFEDSGESRFVFRHVNWEFYEGLLALIGERRCRISYDRGSLELMSPSWSREWWSRRVDRVLLGISGATGIGFIGGGSTTFRRRDLNRGLEPDQCYYTVNAHRMHGPRELDLSVDPPPDLALEVDFTTSSLDRMGIYAALGVPEIWRWNATGIHVFHLRSDGESREYAPADHSLSFSMLPVDRLVDFLIETQNLSEWECISAARDWATAGFPAAGDPTATAVS